PAAMDNESEIAGICSKHNVEEDPVAVNSARLYRPVAEVVGVLSSVGEGVNRPAGIDSVSAVVMNAFMVGGYRTGRRYRGLGGVNDGGTRNHPDFLALRLRVYVLVRAGILRTAKMDDESQIGRAGCESNVEVHAVTVNAGGLKRPIVEVAAVF